MKAGKPLKDFRQQRDSTTGLAGEMPGWVSPFTLGWIRGLRDLRFKSSPLPLPPCERDALGCPTLGGGGGI